MKHGVNRVELRGRVGSDPKINQFEEGVEMARFSIATNETFKNRKGELDEETIWHNVVAWSNKRVPALNTITKGVLIEVIGRLKPVKYTTKEGVERESYEVVANSIKIADNW